MTIVQSSAGSLLASIVAEARVLGRAARTLILIVLVLGAGVVGGYAGGIVAALELDYARQAGNQSHSLGAPGIEMIAAQRRFGTFEEIGRTIDAFNAQFEENWQTWQSIGSYVFSQGWTELKRAWAPSPSQPGGSPKAGNTSDI